MVLSVLQSENRPTLATAFVFGLLAPGGPRRDHQTVSPVLGTIASVIGSNRFFVLHFENNSVFIPLKHEGRVGVTTATERSVA